MKKYLLSLCVCLFSMSCTSTGAAPVMFSIAATTNTVGSPAAFARTNLRQTLVLGTVNINAEVLTTQGFPIYAHHVKADEMLFIDRDADLNITYKVGQPVHPNAKVLFPLGDNELFGVTFED